MITSDGVRVIDLTKSNNQKHRLVVKVKSRDLPWPFRKLFYLVEVSGALLLVIHYKLDGHNLIHDTTTAIHVWELDLIKAEAKRIKLLRDRAIFLWFNASTSMEPSKFIGVKPNHIYYTENFREFLSIEGKGIEHTSSYNLEEKKFRLFCSSNDSVSPVVNPTIAWVMPSF